MLQGSTKIPQGTGTKKCKNPQTTSPHKPLVKLWWNLLTMIQSSDDFKVYDSLILMHRLICQCIDKLGFCLFFQQQKKDQSEFYGDLLEKRRTETEKEQEKWVYSCSYCGTWYKLDTFEIHSLFYLAVWMLV